MDELLYDRQKDLALTKIDKAIVVGLGGTGSWVALFLAMSGCGQLSLFDFDYLEPTNFNRLPLPSEGNIGKAKTEAMKALIASLRPACAVVCEGGASSFTLATVEGDILFDCTDNQDTQITLANWAGANGKKYIRVGYDGTHFTVTSRVPTWRTTEAARTGYEIRPSWVVPAALAACFGVAKAMFAPELEISKDVKEG